MGEYRRLLLFLPVSHSRPLCSSSHTLLINHYHKHPALQYPATPNLRHSSSSLASMDQRIFLAQDGRISPPLHRNFCKGKSIEGLKESLFCTMLELESTRVAAEEELRRKEDYVKELMNLLNKTRRERDEAKDNCQKLVDRLVQSNSKEIQSGLSSIDSSTGKSLKRGDSISTASECDSISLVSSPVQSIFDFDISDYYNNPTESEPQIQLYNPPSPPLLPPILHAAATTTTKAPMVSADISDLDSRFPLKSLPEKGKLLQAVMRAGPLLQTLLLAGPLPEWRHPPPPLDSFQIPPVAIPAINTGEFVGFSDDAPLLNCSTKKRPLGSQTNDNCYALQDQCKKYQRLN